MAAINDLEMEIKQLKNRIEDLVKELEEKENQVVLSAQFGKELLESNTELNHQLEEMQESCLMQVEDLRQENYSLKMKIEGDIYAREHFTSEIENMKEKLHEEANQELCRVTATHEKRIDELQVEIESLQNELEKGALVTEQLQDKIAKQEQMLAEAHKYSKKLEVMGILESQLEELKEECTLVRFKNDEMKITLTDVIDEKEQLLFDQQNLMHKINYLNENLEEKTIQGTTWFDALQDLRQQASEFQMEISVLKAELLNKSHKEKGNSLFGEVEDKRLALEQKYSTVSTKYESLQKIHQIVKRQLHQLKTQILPMLQMASNKADSSKIKRLEAALSKSQNEAQRLNVKMKELQKANNERELGSRLEEFHDAFTDFNKEDKDYVTFLQTEIRCLKKTMEELRSENEIATVKLIAETDKRRETESLLHASEVKKEKLEHEVVRLRLRVDELKMKLHQDLKNTEQIEKCSNDCERRHSIWNDASLFTKKKKTQGVEKPKEIMCEKPPSVEQPVNTTRESQPEAKNASTFQAKINKPAAIQPTPKTKPVGRVLPLNESSKSSDGVKTNKNVISGEEKQHVESMTTPLTESNNTSVSLDHLAADSMLEADIEPSKDDQIPSNYENTENVSISRESTRAKVRRQEPQKRRVIHVKKDAGLKNECNQQ